MKQCGECYFFKNGCESSENGLPDEVLKQHAACADFFSRADYDKAMEMAFQIVSKNSF